MDKKIYEFLKELKFNDAEIENLIAISPTLEESTFQEVLNNMTVVVEHGYPADDISFLISVNPSFLCRNTEGLEADMVAISKKYENVEEALKENPFLI